MGGVSRAAGPAFHTISSGRQKSRTCPSPERRVVVVPRVLRKQLPRRRRRRHRRLYSPASTRPPRDAESRLLTHSPTHSPTPRCTTLHLFTSNTHPRTRSPARPPALHCIARPSTRTATLALYSTPLHSIPLTTNHWSVTTNHQPRGHAKLPAYSPAFSLAPPQSHPSEIRLGTRRSRC
jgi:hypothetical protein